MKKKSSQEKIAKLKKVLSNKKVSDMSKGKIDKKKLKTEVKKVLKHGK